MHFQSSALGRIAFAVGTGATLLEMTVTKLTLAARELRLRNVDATITKWRREGERTGNAYACLTTSDRITAVFLKADASYAKWLYKTHQP